MTAIANTKELELLTNQSDWSICTTEAIKANKEKSIISGPFGSNISSKFFVANGIPVIRGNNLSLDIGVKFVDSGFVYVTEDKAIELDTWATKDDLIFTAVGTIGQVGLLTGKESHAKYIISNKQLRLTVNQNIVLPQYAYYWFASRQMQEHIIQRNTGSSVPLINLAILKSLPIAIPPLSEQKAIAAILSSLDDKIALLHRQNAILEALSEALFRQWFVVEAKEEWEDITIADLFILQRGFDLPAPQREPGHFPVIAASGYNGVHSQCQVKAPGVVTGRSGVIGSVFYIQEDFWPLNTTLWIKKFKKGTPLYSFYVLKKLDLGIMNAGSAVPTLNRNHVHLIHQKMPPLELMKKFEDIAVEYYIKIRLNQTQIHTLEKLRDTLLPKLMSGEVRVQS